jgi:replicative DNA helicase
MEKVNKENLEFLGLEYQYRLMSQLLIDRKFASSIIDIIDPNYFVDPFVRVIAAHLKDVKAKEDFIPDIGSIEFRILEEITEISQQKYILKTLAKIKEVDSYDYQKVQEIAMRFCKQQELKKSIKRIQSIIDKGDDDYEELVNILKKAIEHGDVNDDGIGVMDNIGEALEADFRKPIRTGIEGLDEIMDGGLSKGELALILAPFGTGKTTMITKIANTAVNDGYNVLQIFFEDNTKVIQRKHLSCWSGYELNSLSNHREELIQMCEEKKTKVGITGRVGELKLKKFSSDGTTMPMIRQYIKKKISEGFKPDIVLLDYIDCIIPSKHYDDTNVGEGAVMRQFESMLAELDIAGWTAVQGNRSSIGSNVVESHQMGGSIKKGQIGHFIVSIAKTLDQKLEGTATMAILKSRFGVDGVVFDNIIFNNANMQIDMGQSGGPKTFTQHENDVKNNEQKHVAAVFTKFQARKNALNETVNETINN